MVMEGADVMATRSIPDLGLNYELEGEHPVQAFGEVCGREFYFRAKYYERQFEIADENGILPSDGGTSHFVRAGKHAVASHMPHDEAAALIESFLRGYVATAAAHWPVGAMQLHRNCR
jgi:hypothetical protein